MTADPTRLNDPASGATPALRALLRSTVDDGPSPEQLQRLAARLGPHVGAAPSAPVSPAGKAGITGGTLAAVVAVVVVVAGGGGFVLGRATAPDRPADPPQHAIRMPEPSASPELGRASAPAATSAPPASPSHPESPPAQPPRSRAAAAPHVEHTQPADPARPAETGDEISILSDAQRALVAGDASGALALTVTSAARFPQGAFGEEREALAIEALVALNRLDDARTRLDAFRARYPRSTYRERLQHLVAIAPE